MTTLYEEFRQHGCRITSFTMRDHALVCLENSLIRVVVDLTKGADILELRHKPTDIDCLARTPGPLARPGTRIPTIESDRGTFLDHSYLGWQEVLPNGGPATRWGNTQLGTHGEVSMLEWNARVVIDEPERVEVALWVDLLRMPFRLERRMRVVDGSAALILDERLTNHGEEPLPYMWGHHPDFGPPILGEGAIIELAPGTVHTAAIDVPTRRLAPSQVARWPFVPGLDGEIHDLRRVLPATARVDDSFWLELDGDGWAAVRNPGLDLGLAMLWDASVFRFLWCWPTYGGSLGYPHYGRLMNLAIEPFTSPTAPMAELVASRPSDVAWLEPHAEVVTSISFTFFQDAGAEFVGASDPRVRHIQL